MSDRVAKTVSGTWVLATGGSDSRQGGQAIKSSGDSRRPSSSRSNHAPAFCGDSRRGPRRGSRNGRHHCHKDVRRSLRGAQAARRSAKSSNRSYSLGFNSISMPFRVTDRDRQSITIPATSINGWSGPPARRIRARTRPATRPTRTALSGNRQHRYQAHEHGPKRGPLRSESKPGPVLSS